MINLFYLIFALAKIAILTCIYTTLLLIICRVVSRYKPGSWVDKISGKKILFWLASGFIIAVTLLFYANSYWGNWGLADPRIPLGYGRQIRSADGSQTYLQDDGINTTDVDKFIIADKFVYGTVGGEMHGMMGDNDDQYFVYDLPNNTITTFKDEIPYKQHLISLKLNPNPTYKDFHYYYDEHWNGWRFWLLP